MNRRIPLYLPGLAAALLLAGVVWQQTRVTALRTEGNRLRGEIARQSEELKQLQLELESARNRPLRRSLTGLAEDSPAPAASNPGPPARTAAEGASPRNEGAGMQRQMASMMEDPAMNKMMQATQRAAMGVLYEGLIRSLQLTPEEETRFLDLLVARQMKRAELGMKLMAADAGSPERAALTEAFQKGDAEFRQEIDRFLNSPEDTARFNRYEETLGERMTVNGLAESLARNGTTLSEATVESLVDAMRDERSKFPFTGNHDGGANSMTPPSFSPGDVATQLAELEQLDARIAARVGALLPPDQFQAFQQTQERARSLRRQQLEMAARMFGGGK